ncbi:NAD(P)H-binding protein [Kribbella sp. NPDC004875]|uniref:NAD(P)H-binding protein n=1 Tax=Kribbella sp. NPDC004875 TaxID=3364107 RepID=UPI00369389C9
MHNYLVLGGTGTTGRRVADQLRSSGHSVRTASRTGSDVPLDLDDPATWQPALTGITAAYLMEPTVRPGGRLARFTETALASGVRRLVLLSAARAADPDHPLHSAEQLIRDSNAEWTILHPNWFAQNFNEGPWRSAVRSGTLALPAGEGRTAFIDADDIAAVAADALTTAAHHGRTYDLTGPEAITFAEATAHITEASGRRIEYAALDAAEYTERQVAQGVPRFGAELLAGVLVSIANGEAGAPTGDVEQALGRPARSFKTFAHAADWDIANG